MQQTEATLPQKPRPQWWPKGTSGNPTGIRISQRAMELFSEIAVELGGVDTLSIIDRTLLSQACRLLVRSQRVKEADAAIRMSSEARRTLEGLRRRCAPAVRSAPAEPFGEIAATAQQEEAARRAAELAGDEDEHGEGPGEGRGEAHGEVPAPDKETLTTDRLRPGAGPSGRGGDEA